MHILKILTVAFILLETSGCNGLGFACTDVGCNNGLEIAVAKKITPWENGKYTFAVDADGKKATCTVVQPFVAESDIVCSNAELFQADLVGGADQGVSALRVFAVATKISITVSRDGTQLATQDYAPTYNDVQPNGPSCDPTCHQATADLAVP